MPDADVIPPRASRGQLPGPRPITRRTFSCGAVAGAGLALSGALPAQGGAVEAADLSELFRRRVAQGDPPGLVALMARGDYVRVEVVGLRDLKTGAPMERDTLFAVASIGKPITAASALMLVEDGVLRLDDPIHGCRSSRTGG